MHAALAASVPWRPWHRDIYGDEGRNRQGLYHHAGKPFAQHSQSDAKTINEDPDSIVLRRGKWRRRHPATGPPLHLMPMPDSIPLLKRSGRPV